MFLACRPPGQAKGEVESFLVLVSSRLPCSSRLSLPTDCGCCFVREDGGGGGGWRLWTRGFAAAAAAVAASVFRILPCLLG